MLVTLAHSLSIRKMIIFLMIFLFNFVTSCNMNFKEDSKGDVDHYVFQIAKGKDFKVILKTKVSKSESTQFSLKEGVYYLRTAEVSKNGVQRPYSRIRVMKIESDNKNNTIVMGPTPLNEVLSPGNEEKPSLWKDTMEVNYYIFQIALDPQFKRIIKDLKSKSNTVNIRLKPGLYYLRTTKVSTTGFKDRYSKTRIIDLQNKSENKNDQIDPKKSKVIPVVVAPIKKTKAPVKAKKKTTVLETPKKKRTAGKEEVNKVNRVRVIRSHSKRWSHRQRIWFNGN